MQPAPTITSPRIILPDVSLAAIVRDEMMNPAGGIVDFVHSTVPFVQEAVIIDTGSKDGTRQALEELQAQYPQLRVFDRKFDDYASCRNYSLDQVRTPYALVLDADERILAGDFEQLAIIMQQHPAEGYSFDFMSHYLSGEEDTFVMGHNPRLFLKDGKHYLNSGKLKAWEYLSNIDGIVENKSTVRFVQITINHFETIRKNRDLKISEWYNAVVATGKATDIAPSDLPQSQFWKAYNPRREEFR